jgi:DNA polymerase-3 subunit epsilon
VDQYASIGSMEDCENYIDRKIANYHTNQIIRSYLKKYGEQNVVFDQQLAS